MLEEILKVSIGVIVPAILSLIATRIPNVRNWLSRNSPSYLIIVSATVSAILVTMGFVIYLDIMRRQEIAFLKSANEAVTYATNESRQTKDSGAPHGREAFDWSENTRNQISRRMDYRIGTVFP